MKNKKLNLKSINFKMLPAQLMRKYGRHTAFAGIIVVLLVYIFVVFKINQLAGAEPDQNADSKPLLSIPKFNQDTIDHIQSLENNNPQIHSLFEQARNNPFQE